VCVGAVLLLLLLVVVGAVVGVVVRSRRWSDHPSGSTVGLGLRQRYRRVQRTLLLARNTNRRPAPAAAAAAALAEPTVSSASASASAASSIRVFTLPDDIKQALQEDLLQPRVAVDVTDLRSLEAFLVEVRTIVRSHLASWDPAALGALRSLVALSAGTGPGPTSISAGVVFRNLPLDPYVPSTPTDGSTTLRKPTYVAEAMLLAVGELSGASVVGYESETQYSNPWVHEGFPYPQQQQQQRQQQQPGGDGHGSSASAVGTAAAAATGSALTMPKGMSHHQDMSYHPHPPDLLGLYCLREGHDRTLRTTVILNEDVVDRLPAPALRVLTEDRFQIHASAWVVDGFAAGHEGRPIITPLSSASPSATSSATATATATNDYDNVVGGVGRSDTLDLSIALPVDWTNMVGLDDEAAAALEALGAAIHAAPRYPIHFVEGDLLLFNNRRVVHARSDYTDLRLDGGDRVVDRAYFRREWPSEEARRTRMI